MTGPQARTGDFDRSYFERAYRDYRRQNPPYKLAFYRRLVEPARRGSERPRILDVGCASGLFLAALDPGWERFGVDASAFALEAARAALPDARFALYSDGEFPFAGPFDAITAFDVLEHVADPRGLLRRIAGALAPGGAFVLVVPVYDGPTGPLVHLLDHDPTHLHKRSREFWLGAPPGELALEEWWGIYRYLLPAGPYVHWVTRRLRRASPAIACRFRRSE
jgi:SAM-dependent methyltransferase